MSGARPERRNASLDALLDRIEDRLIDAPEGLHRTRGPASDDALAAAGLPDEVAALWARWDGIDLGNGEAVVLSLAAQAPATEQARAAGLLREGDRVVGEQGMALLVVPADPWAEGGEVVAVEEDGERAPLASSVVRLVLGLVAEMALLYDEEGEYHDELFDSNGALRPKAERKLLRRRLDFDADAPLPRYRLAQLLRRGGEARGAKQELRRVLERAPEFTWAHFELGRAQLELGEREGAARSFANAASRSQDAGLRAYFLAWQASASEDEARSALAREVLALDPGFVGAQESGLREALEQGDARARELLTLGLAVMPSHLGLLSLRGAVEGLPREAGDAGPDEFDTPDEVDVELTRARAAEAALERASQGDGGGGKPSKPSGGRSGGGKPSGTAKRGGSRSSKPGAAKKASTRKPSGSSGKPKVR